MTDMEIRILGVGGRWNLRGSYHPSFLICADEIFLVDLPGSLYKLLEKLRKGVFEFENKKKFDLELSDIENIIITHEHEDHTSGSSDLIEHLEREKKGIKVYTTKQTYEQIKQKYKTFEMGGLSKDGFHQSILSNEDLIKTIFVDFFPKVESIQLSKGCKLTCRRNLHTLTEPVSTFGFILKYGNKSIGYTSDSAFGSTLFGHYWDKQIESVNTVQEHKEYAEYYKQLFKKQKESETIYFFKDCDLIIVNAEKKDNGISKMPINFLNSLDDKIKNKILILDGYEGIEKDTDIRIAEEGNHYEI